MTHKAYYYNRGFFLPELYGLDIHNQGTIPQYDIMIICSIVLWSIAQLYVKHMMWGMSRASRLADEW